MDCYLLTKLYVITFALKAVMCASFVSGWQSYKAQTSGVFKVSHNLGEYPAKVDVQVKVMNPDGSEYIFSGFGSPQRDDDRDNQYGAVVFIYNQHEVYLFVPKKHNHSNKGGLAFTELDIKDTTESANSASYLNLHLTTNADGGSAFSGPFPGYYTEAMIRIRVWKVNDFPAASYTSPMITVTKNTSKKIPHGLRKQPDYATVQVHLPNGYINDGEGAVFHSKLLSTERISGTVFAYNNESVRIWFANKALFDTFDGWSSRLVYTSGRIQVRAWLLGDDNNGHVCSSTLEKIGHQHDTSHCKHNYTSITGFPLIQVQADFSHGEGLVFHGAGTSLTDGTLGEYGGVIYAYNDTDLLLWIPSSSNVDSYMIFIGTAVWGGGAFQLRITNATVTVKVIHATKCNASHVQACSSQTTCIFPSDMKKTDIFTIGDNVTYACEDGYILKSGHLIRYCMKDGQWSGDQPECTKVTCDADKVQINSAAIKYKYPSISTNTVSFVMGDNVTYECNDGYRLRLGNLIRYCMSNGQWTGRPPECTAITCDISLVQQCSSATKCIFQSTITATDTFMIGDNVTYACEEGYNLKSGNLTRYCMSDGKWSGYKPECTEIICDVLDVKICASNISCVYPSQITSTATFVIGDNVTYECNDNYRLKTGNLTRYCMKDGQWSGSQPECTEVTCGAGDVKVDSSTTIYISPVDIMDVSLFAIGDNVTFACADGFRLQTGNLTRYCMSDGQWSGNQPNCTETECRKDEVLIEDFSLIRIFPSIKSGIRFEASSYVTYTCAKDYKLEDGDLTRVCDPAIYQWTGRKPVCTRCRCPCSRLRNQNVITDNTVLMKRIEQVKQQLQVTKSNLSSIIRSKISAPDKRSSSKAIGAVLGIGIISIILLFIFMSDVPVIIQHLRLGPQ